MLKTEDSLRSQGLTYIPTDKPTRARLRELAEREGLPLSHYLRELVKLLEAQPKQGALSSKKGSPVLTIRELKESKEDSVLHAVAEILSAVKYFPQEYARVWKTGEGGVIEANVPKTERELTEFINLAGEALSRAKEGAKQLGLELNDSKERARQG